MDAKMILGGLDFQTNIPEGIVEILYHIRAALVALNTTLSTKSETNELEQVDKPESSQKNETPFLNHQSSQKSEVITLDPQLVREFKSCIYLHRKCDRLLEMVNDSKYPVQLILQVTEKGLSALHVGVMKSCDELVVKLLKRLKDMVEHGSSEMSIAAYNYFFTIAKQYGLTAFDMAIVAGKEKIIKRFKDNCLTFSYSFSRKIGITKHHVVDMSEVWLHQIRELLRPILNEPSIRRNSQSNGALWKELASGFIGVLPGEHRNDPIFCLHFAAMLCSEGTYDPDDDASTPVGCTFLKHVCNKVTDLSLLTPLLVLRDDQGRTPLHACLTGRFGEKGDTKATKLFLEKMFLYFPSIDINVTDFMGRTPLHWAAAQGLTNEVTILLENSKTDPNAMFHGTLQRYEDTSSIKKRFHRSNLYKNFKIKFFCNVTALHLAIINNHVEVVKVLLKSPRLDVNAISLRNIKFGCILDYPENEKWTSFQLAAYMGHVKILRLLLNDPRLYDPGLDRKKSNVPNGYNNVSALHIASSYFHPLAVKALVDSELYDVSTRDKSGNTALHYAATMAGTKLEVCANIYHYVSWDHFMNDPPKPMRSPSEYDILTCIDILMQSGLDMRQKNNNGDTPNLSLSSPLSLQQWWFKKMATEAQDTKNNLSIAAKSISVTAALVATASFVGPLQPPLGLSNDTNLPWLIGYSQVNHVAIQAFFICDCLSFYFGIASTVFAMLPSWPIPFEGLSQEVRIAKRCIQVAGLLLFASIIFVICAFGAASVAIMPQGKWEYKSLAVVCAILGALLCSFILSLSFLRLLKLFAPKSELAKKLSNGASSILLWGALLE